MDECLRDDTSGRQCSRLHSFYCGIPSKIMSKKLGLLFWRGNRLREGTFGHVAGLFCRSGMEWCWTSPCASTAVFELRCWSPLILTWRHLRQYPVMFRGVSLHGPESENGKTAFVCWLGGGGGRWGSPERFFTYLWRYRGEDVLYGDSLLGWLIEKVFAFSFVLVFLY